VGPQLRINGGGIMEGLDELNIPIIIYRSLETNWRSVIVGWHSIIPSLA